MTAPTGPADVGLEDVVWPTEILEEAPQSGRRSCQVAAPVCRYGRAVYQPQIRFALGGSILETVGLEEIASGTCVRVLLEEECPLLSVALVRVALQFEGGALTSLPSAELAQVLAHPELCIREAALLALGDRLPADLVKDRP